VQELKRFTHAPEIDDGTVSLIVGEEAEDQKGVDSGAGVCSCVELAEVEAQIAR
jgi:hypothetical protein